MCIMEGQCVDGQVGDESSPYRIACVSVFEYVSLFSLLSSPLCLVLSRLVLSCLVLWCLVLWCGVVWCLVLWCGVCVCVRWRAAHFPQFPSQ